MQQPSVTDWFGAITGTITASIAVIAIVFAAWQVLEARAARAQTRQLELERAQPYVAMYAELGRVSSMLSEIVVKNFGPTAARDVRIEFASPPTRTPTQAGGEREVVGLPEVIPILAPGQEWRTFWDNGHSPEILTGQSRFEGQVTYLGVEEKQAWWKKPRPRQRMESLVVLDHSIWESAIFTTVYTVSDAAKTLQEMERLMKSFREGIHGLTVYVRSGDKKDRDDREWFERTKELRAQEAARHQASQDPSGTAEI